MSSSQFNTSSTVTNSQPAAALRISPAGNIEDHTPQTPRTRALKFFHSVINDNNKGNKIDTDSDEPHRRTRAGTFPSPGGHSHRSTLRRRLSYSLHVIASSIPGLRFLKSSATGQVETNNAHHPLRDATSVDEDEWPVHGGDANCSEQGNHQPSKRKQSGDHDNGGPKRRRGKDVGRDSDDPERNSSTDGPCESRCQSVASTDESDGRTDRSDDTPQLMYLKSRHMETVDLLFGIKRQGDLRWTDFEGFMKSVGFEEKPIDGSEYRFSPGPNAFCPKGGNPQPFIEHKPHKKGQKAWSALRARQVGDKLTDQYGWTAESFAPK
ncbi:hypothetical protein F5Y16DRAFT_386366 [Xylariaceae sp. FL0255]|nr:hypothetical protein F5Y16DRAFT_386366 [Xylariaceae sp. FL0255]